MSHAGVPLKKPQQSDSPFLPIEQNVLEPGSLEIEVMWFVDDVNVFSETFQVCMDKTLVCDIICLLFTAKLTQLRECGTARKLSIT
jgi:hypothetical protein